MIEAREGREWARAVQTLWRDESRRRQLGAEARRLGPPTSQLGRGRPVGRGVPGPDTRGSALVKQTLFMVAVTLVGTVGAFTHGPICGVVVYYFFAVLRPQYIWEWSLPLGVQWSQYVAIATILAALFHQPAQDADGGVRVGPAGQPTRSWSPAHTAVLLFAVWVVLSYVNAFDRDFGYLVFVDYLKIFTMFVVSSFVIRKVDHLWIIMLLTAASLGYIAYEINFLYFVNGYLGIYRNGYGGLDNNGAGLMLAMGVPLCWFAWEGTRSRLRWVFVAMIPTIVHAVLMTYSRVRCSPCSSPGP